MGQLEAQEVGRVLRKLLYHFPESGHNEGTIVKLAVDWLSLLREEGVTLNQFSAGVKHAVKNCSFFPKLADILRGVKDYRESPPVREYSNLQLPDTTSNELTPEEIARNRARVADILKMLAGEMTIDETVKAVESKNHIQEFGTNVEQSDLNRGVLWMNSKCIKVE